MATVWDDCQFIANELARLASVESRGSDLSVVQRAYQSQLQARATELDNDGS